MIAWPTMERLPAPDACDGMAVEHFTVTKTDSMLASIRGDGYIPPGEYVRLISRWTVWMSNTPEELRTNRSVIMHAHGRILIAGLGLGIILHPIFEKAEVEHVTVLERSPSVIALVEPSLRDFIAAGRLTIVEADAWKWDRQGEKFNVIWLDIWAGKNGDVATQQGKLQRRFQHALDRSDHACWMGSWARDECLYYRRSR